MDALAVDKLLNQSTDSHVRVNRATEINAGISEFLTLLLFVMCLRRTEKVKE